MDNVLEVFFYNKKRYFSRTFVVTTQAGLMILYSLTDDSLTQTKIISASTEIREFQINDSFDNTDEDSGMDEQCSIRTGGYFLFCLTVTVKRFLF